MIIWFCESQSLNCSALFSVKLTINGLNESLSQKFAPEANKSWASPPTTLSRDIFFFFFFFFTCAYLVQDRLGGENIVQAFKRHSLQNKVEIFDLVADFIFITKKRCSQSLFQNKPLVPFCSCIFFPGKKKKKKKKNTFSSQQRICQ